MRFGSWVLGWLGGEVVKQVMMLWIVLVGASKQRRVLGCEEIPQGDAANHRDLRDLPHPPSCMVD